MSLSAPTGKTDHDIIPALKRFGLPDHIRQGMGGFKGRYYPLDTSDQFEGCQCLRIGRPRHILPDRGLSGMNVPARRRDNLTRPRPNAAGLPGRRRHTIGSCRNHAEPPAALSTEWRSACPYAPPARRPHPDQPYRSVVEKRREYPHRVRTAAYTGDNRGRSTAPLPL